MLFGDSNRYQPTHGNNQHLDEHAVKSIIGFGVFSLSQGSTHTYTYHHPQGSQLFLVLSRRYYHGSPSCWSRSHAKGAARRILFMAGY